MRHLSEEIASDRPARIRLERSKCKAPIGLAAFQRNGARRSGGSDSADQPAVEGVRKAQARRNPERQTRVHAAEQTPTAGPRMKPAPNAAPILPNTAARRSGGVTSAM